MNNQLYQLPVQMPMQEDVNVAAQIKGSKPIPFGWEMSNVVLQSFIPPPGKKFIIFKKGKNINNDNFLGHLRFSQLF